MRRRAPGLFITFVLSLACATDVSAAEPDSPYQRGPRSTPSGGAYKLRITPHWSPDNTHFWYRNDLRDGRREFTLVNAVEGARAAAFDHERLAQALTDAGIEDMRAPTDSRSKRWSSTSTSRHWTFAPPARTGAAASTSTSCPNSRTGRASPRTPPLPARGRAHPAQARATGRKPS